MCKGLEGSKGREILFSLLTQKNYQTQEDCMTKTCGIFAEGILYFKKNVNASEPRSLPTLSTPL